jgi:hypothetical protein
MKAFPRRTSRRLRTGRIAAGFALCAVAGVSALGSAAADSIPITANASSSGTRTLSLADASGNALDATHGITGGAGHTPAFVTTVTDSSYGAAKFQVSATMSNLYPYAAGSYTFGATPIPASNVSLALPATALDVSGVTALTQPVVSLTGNLSSVLGLVLGLLGGGVNPANVTTTVTSTLQSTVVQASHVLDGTLASLPLNVAGGSGGAFTTPASLGAGDPVQGGTPTSLTMLSGTPNASPSGLLAAVQGTLNGKTATQLISLGVLDQSSVLSALSGVLGLPLSVLNNPLLINLTNLLGGLTGTVTSLGGVQGQSGTYSASGALNVTVPGNVAAGTYRGVLTLTLADVP